MESRVRVEQDGRVAVITINRPEVRNAFDLQTYRAVSQALSEVRDSDFRAVVLTGGSYCFSAGGDVTTMVGSAGRVTAPVQRLAVAHEVIRGIRSLDQPVIAAVERYALGVAWGVVLACDLVVSGRSAFFQAPFALRGFVADGGTAWHLPLRIGYQRAMRYLLLSERMASTQACDLGLVSHVVDDGEATTYAVELATVLASGPDESNALTKSLAVRSQEMGLDDFLEAERIAVALGAHGRNADEGRRAFKEGRPASFS